MAPTSYACNMHQDIERDLEELILKKTEGPFFIEELSVPEGPEILERQEGPYRLTKDLQAITIPRPSRTSSCTGGLDFPRTRGRSSRRGRSSSGSSAMVDHVRFKSPRRATPLTISPP